MNDSQTIHLPRHYPAILERSRLIGFGMPSDQATGRLIRCLVAGKPNARVLELGTGTGLGACWLLDGMDKNSHLDLVELEAEYLDIARDILSPDERISFFCEDGLAYLEQTPDNTYDFIYADTWPGKYTGFDHSLRVLRPGGMLVIDDMLPQPNWPDDHPPKVERLLQDIDSLSHEEFQFVRLSWHTGHVIITKRQN